MSIPQNHISFDIDHDRTSYEYKLFTLYIFSRLMHRITCTCTYAQAQALVEVAPAPDVATLQLPVAARPLPPGTILSSEDFLLKEFPLDLVPVAAITETISLESQLIVEPIGQGETFSTTKIAGGAGKAVSTLPGAICSAPRISSKTATGSISCLRCRLLQQTARAPSR